MKRVLTGTAAMALLVFSQPSYAVLTDHGITYTLTESDAANPLTDFFTLKITGINGASDTEGGRTAVNSLAFTQPVGFTTASLTNPSGFALVEGGLNSGGCDGSGNFFCFDNLSIADGSPNPQPGPELAANSTLTFFFQVTTATGDFSDYNPAFKIDWVGTKNNYDLVSKTIGIGTDNPPPPPPPPPPPTVPEPGSIMMLLSGLIGAGGWFGMRRFRSAA